MLFADSETQKLLRNTGRAYLADRFPWERLYALERGDAQLTSEELKGLAEMGWLGLLVPQSAGGGGLSLLEAAVVIDELGYAGVPVPITAGSVAAYLLTDAASHGLNVHDHLVALAAGSRLYTVAEASRRRGRGEAPLAVSGARLVGSLSQVPFGQMADFVLAPLAMDGEPAFAALPLEGTRRQPVRLLDRPSYCDVHFDGDIPPSTAVLARGDEAQSLHERCDALITALSLIEMAGMMQRVLEMTAEYISNRVQFGQPIGKFQAARHRAAELLMQTETTRWTAYHALWRFQEDPSDSREIWLAKHWAIRAADRVFQVSHLLHGGVGVGTDYPLHLFTQGIAAFAVRAGAMNEIVARTVESMNFRTARAAGPAVTAEPQP